MIMSLNSCNWRSCDSASSASNIGHARSIRPADPIQNLTPAVVESIDAPTPIRSSGSLPPSSSPGPITYVNSPFSSRSVSIVGRLLSFSPIHAHSSLIFARSLFSHLRAAALAPRPAWPRPTPLSNHAARTQKRRQRCLFSWYTCAISLAHAPSRLSRVCCTACSHFPFTIFMRATQPPRTRARVKLQIREIG